MCKESFYKPIVAITGDKGVPKTQLDTLSKQTGLCLLTKNLNAEYRLHIKTEHLELQKVIPTKNHKTKIETIHIDFVEGKTKHRRLHGGGKSQDIAKAIGLNKIENPTVLDLTAGMGGDSFVLATLGANITLIERNPIVYALLNDAIKRAMLVDDADLQSIIKNLTLINKEAETYLEELNDDEFPDVIYLDPMFPQRNKSAQVKKEMQFFHDIVGSDEDAESLLLVALNKAKKRIVVKRPRLAEKLTGYVNPSFEIVGKTTRFDVYLPIMN